MENYYSVLTSSSLLRSIYGGSRRYHRFQTAFAYRSLYRQRLLHRTYSIDTSCKQCSYSRTERIEHVSSSIIDSMRMFLVENNNDQHEHLFVVCIC
jgi:hypothetical protein